MSRYECIRDGCQRGPATGAALHRTSPKGELFEGMCTEHFDGEPDPIVLAIEARNRAQAAEQPEDGARDA